MVNVWWVNQNNRNGAAINSIVWAPMTDSTGKSPAHWVNVGKVRAGDLVFHYTDQYVVGYSIAVRPAYGAPQPAVYGRDDRWEERGRQLPVDYVELDYPVSRERIPLDVRAQSRTPEGPFTRNGTVAQGYMFPVPEALYRSLMAVAGLRSALEGMVPRVDRDAGRPTDAVSQALRRLEQGALKKHLTGGRSSAPCGLCGQETGVEYLVAAHIKPRAACTARERNDFENVAMLACVFGCDRAFEVGGLRVDSRGKMAVADDLAASRPDWAARVDGETAPAFAAGNRNYFAYRRMMLT